MGDSRGHWDGDSLVVDVRDLNNETWFDQASNHHSEDMRVMERYTLTGPDTLLYEATMTDPKVFTRPWTIRVTLQRHKEPGFRIIEDECLEDANGVRHHLLPFTMASKAAAIFSTAFVPDEGLCAEPVRTSGTRIDDSLYNIFAGGTEMKLAIGLFVIAQFALAQGPSPAPCDRAPAARPNGQAAAGRGRAAGPADPASPEDIAEIAKLSALPAWHPGAGDGDYSIGPDYVPAPEQTKRAGVPEGKVIEFAHEFCREQVLSRR